MYTQKQKDMLSNKDFVQQIKLSNEPVHPGFVLLEFVNASDLTFEQISEKTGIDEYRLNRLMATESDFTWQDAQRLSDVFGTSEGFWMRLQKQFKKHGEDNE